MDQYIPYSKVRPSYLYQQINLPQKSKKKPYQYLKDQKTGQYLDKNLKISTKYLKSIQTPYDLQLKQLQNTKNRSYKQNLNSIFQRIQTNRHNKYQVLNHQFVGNDQNDQFVGNDIYQRFHHNHLRQPTHYNYQKQPTRDRIIKLEEMNKVKSKHHDHQYQLTKAQYQSIKVQDKQVAGCQLYLQKIKQQVKRQQKSCKQLQHRCKILESQLQMHMQKSQLQHKQSLLLNKTLQSLTLKQQSLSSHLSSLSTTLQKLQTKYHQVTTNYRKDKKLYQKELKWLSEQQEEIKDIKRKHNQQQRYMIDVEGEMTRWKQLRQEAANQIQFNEELFNRIQQNQLTLQKLTNQNNLVNEDINILQSHHQQLINLKNKFNQETYQLLSNLHHLENVIIQKKQTISQDTQLQILMKQLQLQIGQINEQKIHADEEIRSINNKIQQKRKSIYMLQKSHLELKSKTQKREQEQYLKRQSVQINMPKDHIIKQQKSKIQIQKPLCHISPSQPSQLKLSSVKNSPNKSPHKYLILQSQQDNLNSFNNLQIISKAFIRESKKNQQPQLNFHKEKQVNFYKEKQVNFYKEKQMGSQFKSRQFRRFGEPNQSVEVHQKHQSYHNQQAHVNNYRNQNSKINQIKLNSASKIKQDSGEQIQSLIQRYQQIKSNSHFNSSFQAYL